MYHFCTLFDQNYLLRGLTLYRSLAQHTPDFVFYVLCLDEATFTILSNLGMKNIQPIALCDLEAWDVRLKEAKGNRSLVEYYFTLSPALPLFILKHYQDVDIITYLDADLFFYQSPAPIYEELGEQSILIIEHRFPEHLREKQIYGRFNVQYQSFRNDEQGLACLEKWHNQCLMWCYDRLEGDKFADQKYLEEWPVLYNSLVILQHKGAGLAPWNWSQYQMTLDKGGMLIDDYPLVFYHFHAIKIINACFISHGLSDFGVMPRKSLKWFYRGYINQLKETAHWLEKKGAGQFKLCDKRIHLRVQNGQSKLQVLMEVLRKLWSQIMIVC